MKSKGLVIILLIIAPILVLALPKGDVDGDGYVKIMDYAKIRNHIRKQSLLTGNEFKRADVDGDGEVKSMDYVIIRNTIIENINNNNSETKNRCCCIYKELKGCSWRNDVKKCPSEQSYEDSSAKACGSTSTPSPKATNTPTPITTSTPKATNNPNPTNNPQPTNSPSPSNNSVKYVNFYDIDNHIFKTIAVETDKEIGTLPTPTRNGFQFDGWYTEKSGGTIITTKTTISKDTNIYAHWSTYYKYVFIIGIDGLGATFKKVSSPNFDKIFGKYAYRYNVKSESSTSSAPNWGSILKGVAYSKHKINNNVAKAKTRTSKVKYPTIFTYIRKAMPKAKLASIVNWQPINHGIVEIDIKVNKIPSKDGSNYRLTDAAVTKEVINYLEKNKSNPPTLMFIHLDEVDAAAHSTQGNCGTCGGFSSKYKNAAKVADKQLGEIYNKIKKLGILDDSLIIAVADHGETNTGHGRHSKEEKEVMLAVRGKTVNKLTFDDTVRNRDVAAIVLYALGIDIPSHFTAKVPNGLFNK